MLEIGLLQQRAQAVALMQLLTEPQFVHLVDDDEQELVVFGRVGDDLLERQQFGNLQVAAVGDVHASRVAERLAPDAGG